MVEDISQVAGRLKFFISNWEKITSDKTILSWIKGYKIPFSKIPIQESEPIQENWSEKDILKVNDLIVELLSKGAIKKCSDKPGQFISNIFLVPKPNGKCRLILNLKKLNTFVNTVHFQLEDGRTVKNLLSQECWMGSIDLQDAYYLISVNEADRKYLRFRFENKLYEFCCLPFGLNCAPYVFTKISKPVAAFLRAKNFLSVVYLDDWLLIGKSYSCCKENIKATLRLLRDLGFIVNFKKSQLIPTQLCKYLGLCYDSKNMLVTLPHDKVKNLLCLTSSLKLNDRITIRQFTQILGFLVSCCPAIKYSWAYTKSSEREKFLALKINNDNYNAKMTISKEIIEDMNWWISKASSSNNPIRNSDYDLEIFSDASLTGWGASCKGQRVFGHWNEIENCMFINYLELLAAFLGLKSFAKYKSNAQILLRIDNTTAISYINRMGGIQYPQLNSITKEIWRWCEVRNLWIFASYISSEDNVEADFESRREMSGCEIELSQETFNLISNTFGQPKIDLFASRSNAKCNKYVSWKKDPESIAVDAFTISWKEQFFYAFPPVCLILKCLKKIKRENACGIMVFPECPSQPWYPLIHDMLSSQILKFKAKFCLSFPNRKPDNFWNKITLVAAVLSGRPSK